MKSLKDLINRHISEFPDFDYYLPIIEKAERNLIEQPDISIECCNSLIQGISKTIILTLDPSRTRAELNKRKTQDLFKPALELLKQNDDVYEDDFARRSASIAIATSTLRNARGDISHGKAVPKLLKSDQDLARVILEMTESLLRYTLACFYTVELEKRELEATVVDTKPEEKLIAYEDNPDFNDFLDEQNPLDGKMLYSYALYTLYLEEYIIQMDEFQYDQEMEES